MIMKQIKGRVKKEEI